MGEEYYFSFFFVVLPMLGGAALGITTYRLISHEKKWRTPHLAFVAVALFAALVPIAEAIAYLAVGDHGLDVTAGVVLVLFPPLYGLATAKIMLEMGRLTHRKR